MTQQEIIKAAADKAFAQIKLANELVKDLQKICTHENTFKGNYSWRTGSIEPALICSDCKMLIKYL